MSAEENIDTSRRRFLTGATTVIGGVGAAFVAVPFLAALLPSDKAVAAGAPVEADITDLAPGQKLTVEWRGKPVWVVRRTEDVLDKLELMKDKLRDPASENSDQPDYAKNTSRASNKEYLVVVGICTHLGCSPTYIEPGVPDAAMESDDGGFFCPCHGSKFDLSGRVYKGVPAPKNLEIPPYVFLTKSRILIGQDTGVA